MGRRDASGDAGRVALWVLVALILAFAVLGVILSFAMGWTDYGMMGLGFGWMGLFMAVPAIVLVLILLVVVGALDRGGPQYDVPLETLNLRLARGEITLEEYHALRTELRR